MKNGALDLAVLIKGGVLSAFSIKLLVWGVSVTAAFVKIFSVRRSILFPIIISDQLTETPNLHR